MEKVPLPIMIAEPRPQKRISDCAIVCLHMLLGRSYADVRAACPRGHPEDQGLTRRQIQNVASRLGVHLVYTPGPPPDDAVGILDLDHDERDHVVIYAKDTVYNPSTDEWWLDVEAFCAHEKFRINGLLWRAT